MKKNYSLHPIPPKNPDKNPVRSSRSDSTVEQIEAH